MDIGKPHCSLTVNNQIKTKKVSFYYLTKKIKVKTFSTNTSKISLKTGKALVERDMFNRVFVACEFAEEDISLKSCYFFPCHPLHCHYLHWMDPYAKDVKLVSFTI